MEVLRDYITYAKENINPEMSPEAKRLLAETYVKMRSVGSGRGQITAYPRQLESLIRLSEAHAKMKLSNMVYESDVQEAARLVDHFCTVTQLFMQFFRIMCDSFGG